MTTTEDFEDEPEWNDPKRNTSAAAREWLSSEEWQQSQQNYLADFKLKPSLSDALDDVLISAFLAGAEWRGDFSGQLRSAIGPLRVENDRLRAALSEIVDFEDA